MDSSVFMERFTEASLKQKRTPSSVLDELGISRSAMVRWKKGYCPRPNIVDQIATKLGVSSAWLSGIEGALPTRIVSSTPELAEIQRIYENLDLKGKVALLSYAFELEENMKK